MAIRGGNVSEDSKTRIQRIAHAAFAQHRALDRVPAMAAGVVIDGELAAFSGFDAGSDSIFRIASMTKSFTAAATLILRDEGKLDLDAPIARYAPEFATLKGPTTDSPAITTRHLLSMQSGLATDDPWGDRHLDISVAELDEIVRAGPLFACVPGTAFEYSNLGYALIGRVMHHPGQRPQAFITERLLKPLGMTRTVWESKDAPAGSTSSSACAPTTAPPEPTRSTADWRRWAEAESTVADLASGSISSPTPGRRAWCRRGAAQPRLASRDAADRDGDRGRSTPARPTAPCGPSMAAMAWACRSATTATSARWSSIPAACRATAPTCAG